jgi:hypothetical protein
VVTIETPMVKSPLRAVLTQIAQGTPTLAAMARNTGLSPDVLRAALDHLIRIGRVDAQALGGCAGEGCSGCALSAVCVPNQSRRGMALSVIAGLASGQ